MPMQMGWRWYGEGNDPITLGDIKQIPGVSTIVWALHDKMPGEIWEVDEIKKVVDQIQAAGFNADVVESVNVHDDIKAAGKNRDRYIEHYIQTLENLGRADIRMVCYNFMPVFDWLRSELAKPLEDGSNALAYDDATVRAMDPKESKLSLPGWDESYTKEGLRDLLAQYEAVDAEKLWENFAYFLHRVIPACKEANVSMAIHPDDPPWPLFGLPRIITGAQSYRRMKQIEPSVRNGITLCTGSLGASPDNDLVAISKEFCERIHFVHARNVKWTGERCFEEAPHASNLGSLDLYEILNALYESGFDGYIRPDHGRMIWGETGRYGYGLYDRALGATYLCGLWEAIEKSHKA